MTREDKLIKGALDLHAHGSPEFSLAMPGRVSNVEWARLASEAGMRGFVIKSHIWPTMGIVSAIGSLFPDLEIYSSITLNPPAGGISALSVELAIEAGARLVWMPTWSARQESPHSSIFLERMRPFVNSLDPSYWPTNGLSILDDEGRLLSEVEKILHICAERGVAVASGHLPISASLLLCRRAVELGTKFVLTHPLSGSVGASLEDQIAVAELGGMIEHVFIGCMPMHQRADPSLIAEAVRVVGAEHCIMSSDAIESWNPPEPEVLRMFVATMLSCGISEDDVFLMTHDNPAAVLGLENNQANPNSTPSEDGTAVTGVDLEMKSLEHEKVNLFSSSRSSK